MSNTELANHSLFSPCALCRYQSDGIPFGSATLPSPEHGAAFVPTSSPAVARSVVYMVARLQRRSQAVSTADDNGAHAATDSLGWCRLHAFYVHNALDGKIELKWTHDYNCTAQAAAVPATVVANGTTVLLASTATDGSSGVIAVAGETAPRDAQGMDTPPGQRVWTFATPAAVQSMTLQSDTMVWLSFQQYPKLVSLDAATGAPLARIDLSHFAGATVHVTAPLLATLPGCAVPGDKPEAVLVAAVALTTAGSQLPAGAHVVAIGATSGALQWAVPLTATPGQRSTSAATLPYQAQFAVVNDTTHGSVLLLSDQRGVFSIGTNDTTLW